MYTNISNSNTLEIANSNVENRNSMYTQMIMFCKPNLLDEKAEATRNSIHSFLCPR